MGTLLHETFDSPLDTTSATGWYTPYSGIESASGARFDPAGVSVANGELVLTAVRQPDGSFHAAGIMHRLSVTTGRWKIRSRLAAGRGIHGVLLLMPDGGVWPPEIDFFETTSGDRVTSKATTITPTKSQQQFTFPCDVTDWHWWEVELTSTDVIYRCDQVEYFRTPNPVTMGMHLVAEVGAWKTGNQWNPPYDTFTPNTVALRVSDIVIEN